MTFSRIVYLCESLRNCHSVKTLAMKNSIKSASTVPSESITALDFCHILLCHSLNLKSRFWVADDFAWFGGCKHINNRWAIIFTFETQNMLKFTFKSKLLSVIEKQSGSYRRCYDVTFSENFVNIRKQRVNNGEMRIGEWFQRRWNWVFIPILPRTSRRMMGIYTMEFLALSHINLSHLQVPENGLFRVQVAGLTVRQFTLTDSTRQIGL